MGSLEAVDWLLVSPPSLTWEPLPQVTPNPGLQCSRGSLSLDTGKLQCKEERPKPPAGELSSPSGNLHISKASSTLTVNLASPGYFRRQAGVHVHSC